MTPKTNKQQIFEESVESKPRSQVAEPTNIAGEAKIAIRDAWDQALSGTIGTVSEQLLGISLQSEKQLFEGQELVLDTKKSQEKIRVTSEHMEYVRRDVQNVERASSSEARVELEVKRGVEQIQREIKRLINTSKIVERTVKDAAIEKSPVKPGKYHLSFFEFVLGVIRDATRKLEDTVHFGSVFQSKKQQSKYWSKYKTHGTTFGLSGERTTATQTG